MHSTATRDPTGQPTQPTQPSQHTNALGQSTSYQYDSAGRLAARKVQASTQADLITQRYGYDAVERLAQIKYLKADGTASEQLIEQLDYSYDAAGRRTGKTALNNNGIGQGETPMSATYDGANRMTALTLTVGAASKTYVLSYDAAGNLTQKQNTGEPTDKTSYTWDASNRLSQIAQTGATAANTLNASFTYDAFGRRIQSSIAQGGQAAQTVQYLYEGQQALGEIRGGNLTHRLLTGLSLDETIARIAIASSGQKDAANSRVFMTDALNSVIAQLSDDGASAGSIQSSYAYSPYGEAVTVGPDATKNPVQYTSRENDGTGLMFYRARYYDSVMKRFISSDPIGLAGGLNTFGYVEGDPLGATDPKGLKTFSCTRPLKGLGGVRAGPLFHQYLCTGDPKTGKMTCGGLGPTPGTRPFDTSPDVNEPDDFSPEKCEERADNNSCVEACIQKKLNGTLPQYDVLAGTRLAKPETQQCQIFAEDTLSSCVNQCLHKFD